jgi:hypothetical protein
MKVKVNNSYCISAIDKKSIVEFIECVKGDDRIEYYEVFRWGEVVITPRNKEEVIKLNKIIEGEIEGFDERMWIDVEVDSLSDGWGREVDYENTIYDDYVKLSEEYGELIETLMEDDGWELNRFVVIEGKIEVTEV